MKKLLIFTFVILALIVSCKKTPKQEQPQTQAPAPVAEEKKDTTKMAEMSGAMLSDKGIGPVKELKLGAIDQKLVQTGQTLFESKCAICHKLDEKKVGPALRDEMKEHSPEFIMNLLLNTAEMQQKNEYMKEEVKEYVTVMPDPKLTQDQARAILEYFRQETESKPEK